MCVRACVYERVRVCVCERDCEIVYVCARGSRITPLSLSVSDLNSREQETLQSVHVINVDIQDNHEEATLGAFLICELCQCVSTHTNTSQFKNSFWDHSFI